MDKARERRVLDYVYGGRDGLTVTPSEQPDFLCSFAPDYAFGVEVAEFFLSESVARFRGIPRYAEELLAREAYRHK